MWNPSPAPERARRPRVVLPPLAAALAITCAVIGCSEDKIENPTAAQPLAAYGPQLLVEPSSGPVGTLFHVRVTLANGDPALLQGWRLVLPWPVDRDRRVIDAAATEGGLLQVPRTGPQSLYATLLPPTGSTESLLEIQGSLEVTGGSADGSFDLVSIPAGAFLQGMPDGQGLFSGYHPQREVGLSAFTIARTELTNQQLLPLVQAAIDDGRAEVRTNDQTQVHLVVARTDPEFALLDLDDSDLKWNGTALGIPAGRELYPARGLGWNGAALWCNWASERDGLQPVYDVIRVEQIPGAGFFVTELRRDASRNGYRLPTEAEWEKAARGGLLLTGSVPNPIPNRWYPWGPSTLHPYEPQGIAGLASRYANVWDLFGDTTPVGSFPAGRSPYGLEDMIGNVSEWVDDWFDPDYYAKAPSADPPGPPTAALGYEGQKVWRGAPFFEWVMYGETGCSSRFGLTYPSTLQSMGLRLARNG